MAQDKIWKLRAVEEDKVKQLQQALKINTSLCQLLINRGITTYEEAKAFFRPTKEMLHNPFLMKGMREAIDRVNTARAQNEVIMIYGDYDVDGTTSVAIVFDFFDKHYNKPEQKNVHYYIPHRYAEGYGLSFKGIDEAKALGCSLIITLDCGTKEGQKIDYARSLGIDVIVCDHHTPSKEPLQVVALLNPKQGGCEYPFKELSACGIGYKLLSALVQEWGLDVAHAECYLDLVATSIAADIVPIVEENRVLAFFGLKKANDNPCLALRALRKLSQFVRPFTISDLVFIIAPRINAAGRMDDAKKAVALFLAQSESEAEYIAMQLQSDNLERRFIDKSTTEEALAIIEAERLQDKKSTVVYKEDWHKGVVGIVASRLIDTYYRPTVVLTHSNGKITGSARSVAGFNIHEAIEACGGYLDAFGGHFFAAGLTMPPENLNGFVQKFEEVVATTITETSLIPVIDIDIAISFKEISFKAYNIIEQMQPFGPLNMKPVFVSYGVKNRNSRLVKDLHIKFDVVQDGRLMSGIGFNMSDKMDVLKKDTFDMVYTIDINEWRGEQSLQLKVIDIR